MTRTYVLKTRIERAFANEGRADAKQKVELQRQDFVLCLVFVLSAARFETRHGNGCPYLQPLRTTKLSLSQKDMEKYVYNIEHAHMVMSTTNNAVPDALMLTLSS